MRLYDKNKLYLGIKLIMLRRFIIIIGGGVHVRMYCYGISYT